MTVGLVRALRCTKYNMLRGRVDACAYDTEQLLLGSLAGDVVLQDIPLAEFGPP